MSRIQTLTTAIREAADLIDNGTVTTIGGYIQPLLDLGITANMHVGRGEEMEGDSEEAKLLTLEWFAGSIVDVVEKQAWFAVNSWLNSVDRFAPELESV